MAKIRFELATSWYSWKVQLKHAHHDRSGGHELLHSYDLSISLSIACRLTHPGQPSCLSIRTYDEFVANATIIVFRKKEKERECESERAERISIHEPKCKHCYHNSWYFAIACLWVCSACVDVCGRARAPFHYDANKQIAHVSIKFSSMNAAAKQTAKNPQLALKWRAVGSTVQKGRPRRQPTQLVQQ